jgi:hypothetical protein
MWHCSHINKRGFFGIVTKYSKLVHSPTLARDLSMPHSHFIYSYPNSFLCAPMPIHYHSVHTVISRNTAAPPIAMEGKPQLPTPLKLALQSAADQPVSLRNSGQGNSHRRTPFAQSAQPTTLDTYSISRQSTQSRTRLSPPTPLGAFSNRSNPPIGTLS